MLEQGTAIGGPATLPQGSERHPAVVEGCRAGGLQGWRDGGLEDWRASLVDLL